MRNSFSCKLWKLSICVSFVICFQIQTFSQCSLSCKGINISIDGVDCEADIRPSDVLTAECTGAVSYTIDINDHHGNLIIKETGLNYSSIFMWMDAGLYSGEEVQIQITAVDANGDGNSCWNTALIEDKKAPELDCGNVNNELVVKCCDGSQIDVALMRSAFEECSDFEVVVLEQSERAASCDPASNEFNYTRILEILAYGVDEFGNQSETCMITVKVERLFPEITMDANIAPVLDSINPFLDRSLLVCPDTLTFLDGDAINCADIDDYETIILNTSEGPIQIPAPIPMSEGGSGVPFLIKDLDPMSAASALEDLDTVYLRTMDSGHPDALDLLASCNVGVSYTDLFMGRTNCITKIRRTWFIREWHCSDEGEIICNQIIEIADTEGPVVLDSIPGFEATTNGFDCHATITLPDVPFEDNCGDIDHIDVIHPLGILRNFDKASEVQKRISLPEGVDTIIYRAYDKCHRFTDYELIISVWDNTPPVPICDDNLVVSLTYDGAAEVRASSFDDGSYDDCQLKTTLVRKMYPDPDDMEALQCECSLHPPVFEDFKSLGEYEGHYYYLSEKPVIEEKAIQIAIAYGGYLVAMDGNKPRPKNPDRNAERNWVNERVAAFFDPIPTYFETTKIITSINKPDIVDLDGPEELYIIELDNPCGFSNSLHFCCNDIRLTETMVVLRAIDKWGNFNECMVSVELQDKSQPEIICPPNLVLACEFDGVDLNTLDAFFGTVVNGGQLDALKGFALTGSGSVDGPFVGFYPGDNPHGTSVDTSRVRYFNNGYAIDNCESSLMIEELTPMDMRDQCGRGEVIRKFIAYNPGQKQFATDPCEQTLTFIPTSDFILDSIETNQLQDSVFCVADLDFCVDISSNTENLFPSSLYGEPVFPGEDRCDLLGLQYEDQVFYVGNPNRTCYGDENEGDFCYKVLRTWTIINWCNLNDTINSRIVLDPQVFYIKDDTNPLIVTNDTYGHQDKEKFCSFDPSCGPATVVIQRRGRVRAASCSERSDLEWYYCLTDADGDEVMNGHIAGFEMIIEKQLPIGEYTLEYALYDKCGNVVHNITRVVVEYCKAPTAYCLNGLAVSLNEHGNVELWASDFAKDVNSACIDGVALSFSATDLDMSNITLCCEDVGLNEVNIYFTSLDANGNIPVHEGQDIVRQSVCTSMISVQDNGGVCNGNNDMGCDAKVGNVAQNGNRALISGSVSRPDEAMIENVEVELIGSTEIVSTDAEGLYAFPNMPLGGQYVVSPKKGGDPVEGVSTLDLVLIQKHILGLSDLDSPYKYIAADINNDAKITALDIVSLRKVILGLTSEFPNNNVWNFIDENYTFFDDQNPLADNYKNKYDIDQLTDDMDINFYAVKTGDVNYSASVSGARYVETRSLDVFQLKIDAMPQRSSASVALPFAVAKEIALNGFQFTIEYDQNLAVFKDVLVDSKSLLSRENIGVHTEEGKITISWHTGDKTLLKLDDKLFTLILNKNQSADVAEQKLVTGLTSSITASEAYINNEVMEVVLIDGQLDAISEMVALHQNTPNPFTDKTSIDFSIPKSGPVKFVVHSVTGQVMYEIDTRYNAGFHTIQLDKEELDYAGVLYYTLQYEGQSHTKQMIIIE